MATKKPTTKKPTTKQARTTEKPSKEVISKRLPVGQEMTPTEVRLLLDKRGAVISGKTLLAILAPGMPEQQEFIRAMEDTGNPDALTLLEVLAFNYLEQELQDDALKEFLKRCSPSTAPGSTNVRNTLAAMVGAFAEVALTSRDLTPEPVLSGSAEDVALAVVGQKLKAELRSDKAELLGRMLMQEPAAFWGWLAGLVPSPTPEVTRSVYLSDGDALNLAPIAFKRMTDSALLTNDGARVTFAAKWMIINKGARTVEFFNVHRNLPGHVACSLEKPEEWLTVRGDLTVDSIEARLAGWPRPE